MTKTEEFLDQYMKTMQEMTQKCLDANQQTEFISFYDYILQHGQFWTPQPLPAGIRKGQPKSCYQNAQRLAARHSDYRYVEGVAYGACVIPVDHAWCVDMEGNVVDNTPIWAAQNGEGVAYFGAPFNIKDVKAWLKGNTETVCVIQNYEKGFPLLKKKGA